MKRQKLTLLALAGVVVLVAGSAAAQAPKPATPATPAAPSGQAPAARPRLVAPIRGEAPLGYTKPIVKPGKDFVVTTMRVKNLSSGSIAGLKIDEFWYNKAGDMVTGANYRHPRPLQPGEVITVTLQTPRNPAMDRNQYKFEHVNGTIKMTLLPKL
jgi:hypothetical protein